MSQFNLHHGECVAVMATMEADSIDAIVCDPPYHLTSNKKDDPRRASPNSAQRARHSKATTGFMGMTWDGGDVAFKPETWREALRVLKPGGHLIAFSGARTYHRMACAIEDAGFEIRDQIMWIYGSGFPKSHNLTDDMTGWGTALKPAHEPIVMARKPIIGTVAGNAALYGTGALHIDACRVPSEPMSANTGAGGLPRRHADDRRASGTVTQPHHLGRWPANVMHDGSEDVLAAFPDAPGQMADASTSDTQRAGQNVYGTMRRGRGTEASAHRENCGTVGFGMRPGMRRLDAGSAARFFYCAKAGKGDRNDGCGDLPQARGGMVSNNSGQHVTRRDDGYVPKPQGNIHPTVKPTELMRYLCRLVTPPGGTVLDPFMGSGSTGKAAILEGFYFVGVEMDADYLRIATARCSWAAAHVEPIRNEPKQHSLNLEHAA